MECIALMCAALVDPGDAVVVEAPSYLGALMAFAGAEAEIVPVDMDDDGLSSRRSRSGSRPACGPKFVYTIPEYQNPTGRTLPLDAPPRARRALPPPRRAALRGRRLPRARRGAATRRRRCGRSAPDVVVQAGTFSKSFFPGVRLGWAVGPADVVAELVAAKGNTDQCAGGLGQRLLEEYGRAGRLRAPPAGRARALRLALGGARRRARARTCPRA